MTYFYPIIKKRKGKTNQNYYIPTTNTVCSLVGVRPLKRLPGFEQKNI